MLKKISKKEYLLLLVISIIALAVRILIFNNVNGDMANFLFVWIDKIKELGKISSLKHVIGDYNTPYMLILTLLTYIPLNDTFYYMYFIKLISVIFDFVVAFSSLILIFKVTKNKKKAILGYIIVLLLPTVYSNSSAWGQCDAIYTAFVLISLIYLIDNKFKISMIFLGIAFSFKLQTILIMPLYVYVLLSHNEKKIKIRDFLIIPITFFVMGLPSVIMGKSLFDTYGVYLLQTNQHQNELSLSYYNFYYLFGNDPNKLNVLFQYWGIIILAVVFISSYIYVFVKKIKLSNSKIIELALWCVMLTTFFLPRMHERYGYMADVLSVIYVLVLGKKRIIVPIIMQVVSVFGYLKSCYIVWVTPVLLRAVAQLNLLNLIYVSVMMFEKSKLFKLMKKDIGKKALKNKGVLDDN